MSCTVNRSQPLNQAPSVIHTSIRQLVAFSWKLVLFPVMKTEYHEVLTPALLFRDCLHGLAKLVLGNKWLSILPCLQSLPVSAFPYCVAATWFLCESFSFVSSTAANCSFVRAAFQKRCLICEKSYPVICVIIGQHAVFRHLCQSAIFTCLQPAHSLIA